jgi:Xaa-Pro aminopeptidase
VGYTERQRLQSLLEAHSLDGLLVTSPENYAYFTGDIGNPASMWRRVGPTAAVISADGEMTIIVPDTREPTVRSANPDAHILAHTLWIEQLDVDPAAGQSAAEIVARATAGRNIARPETYDETIVSQLIRQAVGEAGLLGKRLGVELEFAPVLDVETLHEQLGDTEIVNSSPLIRELRLIKTPREIELLRLGNQLTELGITASLEHLSEQTIALDIVSHFNEAIYRAVRDQRVLGFESARTMVHVGPRLWGRGDPFRPAQRGDLIQFDSGVQILGYASDIGRTFSYGQPSDTQQSIEDALLAGFAAGREQLQPGRRFADVFNATQDAVRAAGFPSYTRGHFGHSIGSDFWGEEWPWISASEDRLIEPGMVIAFEVPYYVDGIGGFQNEDNFLITDTGWESMNTLPLELVVLD